MQKELENVTEELQLDQNRLESTLQTWKEDILAAAKLDEESRNKRYCISVEEVEYICHLLTLDVLTPKQKTLLDVAEKIYKQKSKQFQPKICDKYLLGEVVLRRNAVEYLRHDMECHQNAISVLAFSMGKLPVPLVTKRSVVDKLMEIQRFQEEVEIIEKEMFYYLEYYTKKCIPGLYSEETKLENLLGAENPNCDDVEQPVGAVEDVECLPKTYSTTSIQETTLRGKLALVNEGINFSMGQLRGGITYFLPILGLQVSGFRDILDSHYNGVEQSCEEDTDNEEEAESDTDNEIDNDNGSISSDYELDT